jgi:hypothetical protein
MYAGLMQATGWTEAPLLLQFVPVRAKHNSKPRLVSAAFLLHPLPPALAADTLAHAPRAQTTVSTLMTGLGGVLSALAAQPGLPRLFPGLSAPPADAALAQWAACATLGGKGVRDLGSDAINSALPWAPEFCAWAVSVMGVELADARLPLGAAATFLATLRSSAHNGAWVHARTHADVAAPPFVHPPCVWLIRPFICGADDALPTCHTGAGAERDGRTCAPATRVRACACAATWRARLARVR